MCVASARKCLKADRKEKEAVEKASGADNE